MYGKQQSDRDARRTRIQGFPITAGPHFMRIQLGIARGSLLILPGRIIDPNYTSLWPAFMRIQSWIPVAHWMYVLPPRVHRIYSLLETKFGSTHAVILSACLHEPNSLHAFSLTEKCNHYRPETQSNPLFILYWAPSRYQVPLNNRTRVLRLLSLIFLLRL